jgi:molecular chaperone DnaJ
MDACKGTKKTIEVTPVVDCSPCTGTGLKPGIKRTKCSACNGTGTRTFVVDSGFRMASTCQVCRGVGTVVPQGGDCASCDGLGKVRQRKSVVVNIPAGMNQQFSIRFSSLSKPHHRCRRRHGDPRSWSRRFTYLWQRSAR